MLRPLVVCHGGVPGVAHPNDQRRDPATSQPPPEPPRRTLHVPSGRRRRGVGASGRRGVGSASGPADQATRPAVLFRKISGGHRSRRGAHTHEVLTSIGRTCGQRSAAVLAVFVRALFAPRPVVFAIESALPAGWRDHEAANPTVEDPGARRVGGHHGLTHPPNRYPVASRGLPRREALAAGQASETRPLVARVTVARTCGAPWTRHETRSTARGCPARRSADARPRSVWATWHSKLRRAKRP